VGWTSQIANLIIVETSTGFTGFFVYDPSPGAGNLITSITGAGVSTDPYGNTVDGGGVAVYDSSGRVIFLGPVSSASQLQFTSGTGLDQNLANIAETAAGSGNAEVLELLASGPSVTTSGHHDWVQAELVSANKGGTAGAAGFLNYINNAQAASVRATWNATGFYTETADGNAYNAARLTLRSSSTTNITSVTPTLINNLQANVVATTYRVQGTIVGTNGSSGTLQPQTIRFNGSATASSADVVVYSYEPGEGTSPNIGRITALNADPDFGFGGSGPALNATMIFQYDGVINVSGAGTLGVYGRNVTSSADVAWTALVNSWFELKPIY
jgi:hypothetical protein